MVHPKYVIDALQKGADGVIIMGCHIGDCHYMNGNNRAEDRAKAIRALLEDIGMEQERFHLEWVSASEGQKFADTVKGFVEQVQKLGPSPYRK